MLCLCQSIELKLMSKVQIIIVMSIRSFNNYSWDLYCYTYNVSRPQHIREDSDPGHWWQYNCMSPHLSGTRRLCPGQGSCPGPSCPPPSSRWSPPRGWRQPRTWGTQSRRPPPRVQRLNCSPSRLEDLEIYLASQQINEWTLHDFPNMKRLMNRWKTIYDETALFALSPAATRIRATSLASSKTRCFWWL